MNSLHERVEQYLAIRRALGFKLEDHGRLLPRFVAYIDQCGAATVTVEAALAWATAPQGVDRFRWRQRLSVVRGFARWLQSFDPATQVPPADLLAYRRTRPVPYCSPRPTSTHCWRPSPWFSGIRCGWRPTAPCSDWWP
jgi:hypothetical protein